MAVNFAKGERMRILYSAFECNPKRGSDAYVGWSWAKTMSKTDEIHVLTDVGNKEDIERFTKENPTNATFHFVDVPKIFSRFLVGRKGYFARYYIWQWSAYRYAKSLSKEVLFDIIHHVSIADFRVAGQLWRLRTPFVYGPVGGGQETPKALMPYVMKYSKREKIRVLINRAAMLEPSYRKAMRRAAAIFVSNDETKAAISCAVKRSQPLRQMCELGVDEQYLKEKSSLYRQPEEKVHVLVSGRLMYRKGLELLLDACLFIDTEMPYVVDVYGGGHEEDDVRAQIRERKLQDKVILHGKVPYEQMSEVYQKSDVFALPSLRETTGTAVVEAMANKLPVVALKQNGVKYLVGDDAGILADIGTKEETIQNLAAALQMLIDNPTLRASLGARGHEKLKEYTWEAKAKQMKKLYCEIQN